jgi:hypothetical protein
MRKMRSKTSLSLFPAKTVLYSRVECRKWFIFAEPRSYYFCLLRDCLRFERFPLDSLAWLSEKM